MNYKETESSESEADETFNSVASNLSTPTTPLSPSHWRFPYQTSPPPTNQVLRDVASNLRTVESIQSVVPNWPALGEGVGEEDTLEGEIVEEPENLKVGADNSEADMAEFDVEDDTDGEKAQDLARSIKVEWSNDVKFWFSQLEGEMLMASVKSQWLKRTILQRNLPTKQKEDVKSYLTMTKAEAGNTAYMAIKKDLIRIYATKPTDSYRRALGRTMVGLPSQLGLQIVDDVCEKGKKLEGCCCSRAAQTIWGDKLPIHIRGHISSLPFNSTTYKEIFEKADQVHLASQQVQVAAVMTPETLDETLPAFSNQNQPQQVAAVANRGRGRQSGTRGGGGNNKGNGGGRGSTRGGRGNRGN